MSEIIRWSRTLSDAFKDERSYCIFDDRGRPLSIFVKRRPLWWRIWRFFT
jgi:hypothetical protein